MKEIFDSNDEGAAKLLASSMTKEEFTTLITEWLEENYQAIISNNYMANIDKAKVRRGGYLSLQYMTRLYLFGATIECLEFLTPDIPELVTTILNHLYKC